MTINKKYHIWDAWGPLTLILFALTIFGMIGFQIYTYLKVGYWQPISMISVLQYFGVVWAFAPKDWLGIWKICDFFHGSILLVMIIPFISGFGISVFEDILKKR